MSYKPSSLSYLRRRCRTLSYVVLRPSAPRLIRLPAVRRCAMTPTCGFSAEICRPPSAAPGSPLSVLPAQQVRHLGLVLGLASGAWLVLDHARRLGLAHPLAGVGLHRLGRRKPGCFAFRHGVGLLLVSTATRAARLCPTTVWRISMEENAAARKWRREFRNGFQSSRASVEAEKMQIPGTNATSRDASGDASEVQQL